MTQSKQENIGSGTVRSTRPSAVSSELGSRLCLGRLGIWFDVSARAKDIDSLVKKLLRKDHHTYQSLPDKVGIRVVVRYRSDIGAVLETLNDSFDCEEPDDKVRGLGTDRVGYQSVHLG